MKNSALNIPGSTMPNTHEKTISGFIKNNPVVLTVLLALLCVSAVYIWKEVQKNKQLAIIEKNALETLDQNNRELLTALSKPLIWSIRAEMLKGNLEQVNIYVKDMVKEKNFQLIQVIGADGNIALSTNKKLEGQKAATWYDSGMLNTDTIKIYSVKNNLLIMYAPIMGYDKKLGVLVIEYDPVSFSTIH